MFSCSIFSCNSQNFHINTVYDAVMPFSNGIAAVKQNNRWGFIDTLGNWVFKPEFTSAGMTPNLEYIVAKPNESYRQILQPDKIGQGKLNSYYGEKKEIKTSKGIRIIEQENKQYDILDQKKNKLTNSLFDSIIYIGQDLFIGNIKYSGDQLIDADGIPVSEFYEEITPEIVFDRIKCKKDGYSGLLSLYGKVLVKPEWWLLEIAGKNIACTKGGNLKLFSDQLTPLSDFEFDRVQHFENGNWLGRNTDTGESKIFNPEGKVMVDGLSIGYDKISMGLIPAGNVGNLWGYIDGNAAVVVPFKFKYAESFMPNGQAVVWKDVKGRNIYCLIDLTGNEITTPPFDKIEWHRDGVYTLEYENKNQLLDNKFQPITGLSKDPVEYIGEGVFIQYKAGRSVKIQKPNFYTGDKFKIYLSRDVEMVSMHALDGSLLVKVKDISEDDPIPKVSEGLAMAKKGSKWGFIRVAH